MPDLPVAMLNRVANYLRGGGQPTSITGVFLDIFNGDPQGAGASVLATITGSASRPNITASLGAAANGVSTNAAVINITSSAAAGGTITHLAFYDAATGGNLIASKVLSSGNMVVTAGNAVQINANGISLSAT
jgi:hypothetical protein